ncbi:CPBP family intramembrane metalloprotease [Kiritimatiellaeota bacterium B1221]|nr:CPBP family intramembrane metalloprotease [Kiritimatiellaeota bacterium B1221]
MPEGYRPEILVFRFLLFSGVFFWVSFLLSKKTTEALSFGSRWLEWRPLPHDLTFRMVLAFFTGFVLQQIFGLLLFTLQLVDQLPIGMIILLPMVFFQGLMTFVLYAHLHRTGLNPLEVLGMEEPFRVGDQIWGVVGFCMCLPVVALFSKLTEWLYITFQWELETQPILEMVSHVDGWMNWLSMFLLVGFIGPLLEEVVFRGFLHTWLHQKLGLMPGLLLQAVLFSLIHSHTASLLPLFSLAVLLGLVYIYTRRLMACVWIHALYNTMTLIVTFFFAGGEMAT